LLRCPSRGSCSTCFSLPTTSFWPPSRAQLGVSLRSGYEEYISSSATACDELLPRLEAPPVSHTPPVTSLVLFSPRTTALDHFTFRPSSPLSFPPPSHPIAPNPRSTRMPLLGRPNQQPVFSSSTCFFFIFPLPFSSPFRRVIRHAGSQDSVLFSLRAALRHLLPLNRAVPSLFPPSVDKSPHAGALLRRQALGCLSTRVSLAPFVRGDKRLLLSVP